MVCVHFNYLCGIIVLMVDHFLSSMCDVVCVICMYIVCLLFVHMM